MGLLYCDHDDNMKCAVKTHKLLEATQLELPLPADPHPLLFPWLMGSQDRTPF